MLAKMCVSAGLLWKAHLSTTERLSGAGAGAGGGGGAGWAEGGGSSYWRRAPPILGLFQNVSQSAELARLKAHMSTERAS